MKLYKYPSLNLFNQYNSSLVDEFFSYATDSINQKFYNIEETELGYSIELELPGFKKNEVSVEIKESILTVLAKSNKREISKSFSVGNEIDSENIGAALEDGILRISLNKKELPAPKKILIK